MAGFVYDTSRGAVIIAPLGERWCIIYNNENLGSYHSPTAAADDVAGGHTVTPANGVDLGILGISPDLRDWQRL
jgi:hypothetical protein